MGVSGIEGGRVNSGCISVCWCLRELLFKDTGERYLSCSRQLGRERGSEASVRPAMPQVLISYNNGLGVGEKHAFCL